MYAVATNKPRYFLTRLYVALSVLVNIIITAAAPAALGHQIVSRTGPTGWVLLALLAGLACVAVLDVIVNDVLPERFAFAVALRWRHLIYMLLPLGTVSMVFVIVSAVGHTALIYTYLLDGAMSVVVAVLDLFYRNRQRSAAA